MIIANDKGIIKDRTALNAFFANLAANGTYEVHQPVVEDAFRHLPIHLRDADLFLLPGAYKTGNIAMMDNNGNIVDLGFSRGTIRSAISEYEYTNYQIDTPRLDNFNYSNAGVNGYLIEEARHNFLTNFRFPNNSIFVPGATGSQTSLLNPYTRTLLNDGLMYVDAYGEHIGNRPSRTVDNSTGKIYFNIFFRVTNPNPNAPHYVLGDNYGNGIGNNPATAHNDRFDFLLKKVIFNSGSAPDAAWKYYSHKELPNGMCRVTFVQNNITRLSLDNTHIFWLLFTISNNPVNAVRNIYKDGASYSLTNYVYTTEAEGGGQEHFDFTTLYRAPDMIFPITLTNNAAIFIKTAKGIQEFTVPAGSFNIHDYVVNDKLITMAIKYL